MICLIHSYQLLVAYLKCYLLISEGAEENFERLILSLEVVAINMRETNQKRAREMGQKFDKDNSLRWIINMSLKVIIVGDQKVGLGFHSSR